MTQPKKLVPAKLLNSSCSLKTPLQCSCSYHGIPTPSVKWWVGNVPVRVNNMDDNLRVTSTIHGPWANSTISLTKKPQTGTSLTCRARNRNGNYGFSFLLLSEENQPAPQKSMTSLLQGVLYGVIATTLLFLCLIPLIVKHIRKKWTKRIAEVKEKAPSSPNTPKTRDVSEAKRPRKIHNRPIF